MTTQQYRTTNFRADTLATIKRINAIVDEYDGQRLTARQVYYQFVSRDWIPNTPRSYQNLTSIITDARYAGMVSWDIIEDRGREADVPSEWSSIDSIINVAIRSFRLPRWEGQPRYVELWVEKQALAGVLSPIASKWHVPLMVNKGYSSASAMHAAAQRMLEAVGADGVIARCENCLAFVDDRDESGKCGGCGERCPITVEATRDDVVDDFDRSVVVIYLGDHDPSGEDMVRDIRDRLTEFGVPNLEVVKLALTMAQIRKFNPPPNPAKITDSRAAGYIEKHGNQSWELDALPPRDLNRMVEAAIGAVVDKPMMDAVIAREEVERERVRKGIAIVREMEEAKARHAEKTKTAKPKKGKKS